MGGDVDLRLAPQGVIAAVWPPPHAAAAVGINLLKGARGGGASRAGNGGGRRGPHAYYPRAPEPHKQTHPSPLPQNCPQTHPRADPVRRPSSLETIRRREFAVQGPILLQPEGFEGLLLRLPVFLPGVEDPQETWGWVGVWGGGGVRARGPWGRVPRAWAAACA
jgi:hypothetical protein